MNDTSGNFAVNPRGRRNTIEPVSGLWPTKSLYFQVAVTTTRPGPGGCLSPGGAVYLSGAGACGEPLVPLRPSQYPAPPTRINRPTPAPTNHFVWEPAGARPIGCPAARSLPALGRR